MTTLAPDRRGLTLRPYQVAAVDHLRRNPRAALFLDMGLGKTAITLSALTPEHLPALVIAPKRVAEHVWEPEARLWRPDLTVKVIAGTRGVRHTTLANTSPDVTVIGRDNMRDLLPHLGRYRTVILDELSGFKSRSSQRWKVARRIVRDSDVLHRWGLTGTPAPNGLLDLWAQLALLDDGERLGRTLGGFRDRYFVPGRQLANGVITEWLLRPGADRRIHSLIDDICLSMGSEGRVDLPPTLLNQVTVPLPPAVMRSYRRMKDDLVADLGLLGGEVHSAANAAVLTSKLSQISAGALYVDDADIRGGKYDTLHWEKARAVEEIVTGTGSPVLVFYRYRFEREMLRATLANSVHTMDEPDIVERWNDRQVPVLLAHPASAGHGLNLQYGGHTIVWATMPWSLEEWEQANRRLARSGQTSTVVIHTLLSPRTIDREILRRLEGKATVQDALRAHLESPL